MLGLDDLGSQSLPHQSLLKWSACLVGEMELQAHAILATMSFRKEPNCNFLTPTCLWKRLSSPHQPCGNKGIKVSLTLISGSTGTQLGETKFTTYKRKETQKQETHHDNTLAATARIPNHTPSLPPLSCSGRGSCVSPLSDQPDSQMWEGLQFLNGMLFIQMKSPNLPAGYELAGHADWNI